MWIAVTGAQGSGKSTIVRALMERLEGRMMPLVPVQGIGAFVGSLKFPLGESATRDTISAFLLEHVRRERHAPSDAVFDRCLIDLVAYAMLQLKEGDPILDLAVELAQISMQRFRRVFLTAIPSGRVNVSSAHESATFRARFEGILPAAAYVCGAEVIRLEGSVDERIERALEALL
jgi:predicted ATPase